MRGNCEKGKSDITFWTPLVLHKTFYILVSLDQNKLGPPWVDPILDQMLRKSVLVAETIIHYMYVLSKIGHLNYVNLLQEKCV